MSTQRHDLNFAKGTSFWFLLFPETIECFKQNDFFFFFFSQGEYKLEKYMPPLSSVQLALGSPQRPPQGVMVQQSLTPGNPRLQLRLKCSTLQQRDGGCSEQVPQSNAITWSLNTGSLFLGIKPLGQVLQCSQHGQNHVYNN